MEGVQGLVPKAGPHAVFCSLTKMQPTIRMLITGRSKSGKTSLAVGLIETFILPFVHRVIVVCPTAEDQVIYDNILSYVSEKDFYDEELYEEDWDEILSSIVKEYKESNKKKRTLLIVDDCASDSATNAGRKSAFSRLVTLSNHKGTSIVGIFQQVTTVTPSLRDNAEMIVTFPPARSQDFELFMKEFVFINNKKKRKECVDRFELTWKEPGFIVVYRPGRRFASIFKNFDEELIL